MASAKCEIHSNASKTPRGQSRERERSREIGINSSDLVVCRPCLRSDDIIMSIFQRAFPSVYSLWKLHRMPMPKLFFLPHRCGTLAESIHHPTSNFDVVCFYACMFLKNPLELVSGAGIDDGWLEIELDLTSAAAGGLELLDDLHAGIICDLAEDDVLAIEPRGDDGGDEELGAVPEKNIS